jgi:hypothetical protein
MPEPMRCPVCRADNAEGSTCRRCKADLSLLRTLEIRREALLQLAWQHTRRGEWTSATAAADTAARLRAGDDAWKVKAVVKLLSRDFAGALAAYCQVRSEDEMAAGQNGLS